MRKTVIAGAETAISRAAADYIMDNAERGELIFTSPSESALHRYKDAGIDTRVCDFEKDDGASALSGARAMFLPPVRGIGEYRRRLYKSIISAATAAGVERIILVSVIGADDGNNPWSEREDYGYAENLINASGFDSIFLRLAPEAQTALAAFERAYNSGGELKNNHGDGRVAYISQSDCARAAAAAVLTLPKERIYTLTGAEAVSDEDFLRTGTLVMQKYVRHINITDDEMYALLQTEGLPRFPEKDFPYCAQAAVTRGQAVREGFFATVTDDFERLTGLTPASVKDVFENRG